MSSAQKYTDSKNSKHFSNLLQHFLAQHQEDEIYLRDLLHEMGDRAFGPTLLICALPEALPLPVAGISAFVGIPLILVSTQLIIGFRQPWLPHWLLERSFKRQHFERLVRRALHPIEKLEQFFKPRWRFFTNPTFERLIGVLLLLLAVIIALPVPFANMVPAIAIMLICLGMIEQDGVVIAISSIIICAILILTVVTIITVVPPSQIP
jgi:hypothetical protein